ncbi:hypothetical protein CLV51_103329 [Chitinophaga niastensis]|uniref:Outer membrane protein n=1 Tax=Chitinophaga niastensis TaxID=536980 RepID=A0A2P8HJG4_CHINA|nr:hypothetical protein [Chitinophaga niastensis]PSL46351.1 hypothetical protein CLV51_103329 [Chitinophaga niastensis]
MKRSFVLRLILVSCLHLCTVYASAQDSTMCGCNRNDSAWKAAVKDRLDRIVKSVAKDSVRHHNNKVKDTLPGMAVPRTALSSNRLLSNHYLSYNLNYVSHVEGVYDYSDIVQQFLTYKTDLSVFKDIPLGLTLNARYSNSPYFRNYIDFQVDLKGNQISSLAEKAGQENLQNTYRSKGQALKGLFENKLKNLEQLQSELVLPSTDGCVSRYIHCKEMVSNKDVYGQLASGEAGKYKDSLSQAEQFVAWYEKRKHYTDSVKRNIDSLSNQYKAGLSDVNNMLGSLQSGSKNYSALLLKYSSSLKNFDTTSLERKHTFIEGFNRLVLGRSFPSSTQLNFQNISINGINTEYQFNNAFVMLQAGWTDFGLRDFVFKQDKQRISSFVYATGVGWGKRNSDYVMVSLFGGEMGGGSYSGVTNAAPHKNVQGVSLSGQWVRKNITLNAEVAQSTYPDTARSGKIFNLNDHTNKAYGMTAYTNWPQLQLNASGYYKYYGINYYGFNAYRIPATNSLWGVQAEKYFFGRLLSINAAVKKNDYQNPYVQQVYSGQNTIVSVQAGFRKRRWPYISVGYIPSYQYVSINDTIYQNRYQVLNAMLNYQYKLGVAMASSGIIINHFISGGAQTAIFYGNSTNFILNQVFQFEKYSSGLNASVLQNTRYKYVVFDGYVSSQVMQRLMVKGGFKINSMAAAEYNAKLGGYGGLTANLAKTGILSVNVDYGFYPDLYATLHRNIMGTIGFTTFFK